MINTKILENIPGKGVLKTVEPIRKLKDIKSISMMLITQPRNHLLFTLGVNNGLRAGDLIRIKVGEVKYKQIGESIMIVESKTNKRNQLMINKPVFESLHRYLTETDHTDDDFLFKSRKGDFPISIAYLNRLIKRWTDSINLKGKFGAHTLRKTWGYIQRVEYGVSFEVICKRFLHCNPATTMRYIGVQDSEVNEILLNEIC